MMSSLRETTRPPMFQEEFAKIQKSYVYSGLVPDNRTLSLLQRWLMVPSFRLTPAEFMPVFKLVEWSDRDYVMREVLRLQHWEEKSLGDSAQLEEMLVMLHSIHDRLEALATMLSNCLIPLGFDFKALRHLFDTGQFSELFDGLAERHDSMTLTGVLVPLPRLIDHPLIDTVAYPAQNPAQVKHNAAIAILANLMESIPNYYDYNDGESSDSESDDDGLPECICQVCTSNYTWESYAISDAYRKLSELEFPLRDLYEADDKRGVKLLIDFHMAVKSEATKWGKTVNGLFPNVTALHWTGNPLFFPKGVLDEDDVDKFDEICKQGIKPDLALKYCQGGRTTEDLVTRIFDMVIGDVGTAGDKKNAEEAALLKEAGQRKRLVHWFSAWRIRDLEERYENNTTESIVLAARWRLKFFSIKYEK